MAATLLGKINTGNAGTNELAVDYIVGISAESDWNSALAASGLPACGSVHPSRAGYYAIDISARPANEQNHYRAIVTVRYQPTQVSTKATAPWLEAATYTVADRPQAFYDGKYYDTTTSTWVPNTNSAGEFYDPTQPREIYLLEIVISAAKEAASWTPSNFDAARGKVNSASVTVCGRVCAAYCLKLTGLTYTKKYWLNPTSTLLEAYYDVTWTVTKHPETWKLAQFDCGFRVKGDDGKWKAITEPNSATPAIPSRVPVTRLAKLNKAGAAMSDEDQANPAKGEFLDGRLFCETYAFVGLALPAGE